jgi:hypothetical protein
MTPDGPATACRGWRCAVGPAHFAPPTGSMRPIGARASGRGAGPIHRRRRGLRSRVVVPILVVGEVSQGRWAARTPVAPMRARKDPPFRFREGLRHGP